jgi:hypothetical protein
MSDSSENDSHTLFLRLYTDKDGKVFLLYEALDQRVEVTQPVTKESLKEAQYRLIEECTAFQKSEDERFEGTDEATATAQQKANRVIKEVLGPEPRGPFLSYAMRKFVLVFQILFAVLLILAAISFLYKGVELSQEHLPEYLHWVVLALYLAVLTLCVYLMATEEKRRKESARIRDLFGPRGMLVLPSLTLLTAASVFASITLSLHKHGLVLLQECTGRPVAAGSLTDFYMWHFLKLVPLVKINEVLKLNEPLCYSQKRVGLLILIFQALVVIPSVNTVLYYWKHRHELSAPLLDYHFELGWEPNGKKAEDS